MAKDWARSAKALMVGAAGRQVAIWAMPGLPGQDQRAETLGDWRRRQARACSRPPEPMINIFKVALEARIADVGHAEEV